MESFPHFAEAKDSSNRIRAMTDLFDALKAVFNRYDVPTRRLIWKRLNTAKGHELVERLLRNPKTDVFTSAFRKLVEGD